MDEQNQVEVTGEVKEYQTVAPLEIPARTVTFGTQDINIGNGQDTSIPPGAYDEIHLYAGATARFTSGTYAARRFIVEAGPVNLKFDIQNGVVNFDAEEQLRFADFTNVELLNGDDVSNVRFYTNDTGQVKIGTNSVFKGIVTAPLAEVYVFPRSSVTGAIAAKSVVVDVDSVVEGVGCEEAGDDDGLSVIEYTYDNEGHPTSVQDDNGNTTTMAYNCRGQLSSRTNADGSTISFEYNSDGEKTKTVDERGNAFAFTRDDSGNTVRIDISRANGVEGTTVQAFRYDGLGHRTRLFDNNDPSSSADDSEITRVYDSLGRIVEENQNGNLVSYGYESFVDGAIEMIYPNGDVAEPQYDSLERETAMLYNGQEFVRKSYFGQEKKLLSEVFGNRIIGDRLDGGMPGYDGAERPTYLAYRDLQNSQTTWLSYRNAYDRDGNTVLEMMNSAVKSGFQKSFRYDKNNRMVSFLSGTVDSAQRLIGVDDDKWVLDGVGNRVIGIENGLVSTYLTNEVNRYLRVRDALYLYDASGNVIRIDTETDAVPLVKTFAWDAFNRLTRFTSKLGGNPVETTHYIYDAENRRVKKDGDETDSFYAYREHDSIYEIKRAADGSVLKDINYVLGEEVDTTYGFIDNLNGTKYFFLKDQFNSVGAIVDANGNAVEYYTYGPYGQISMTGGDGGFQTISEIDNSIFFQSRERDFESGLYYYRARYFAPNLGRFISVDPILFDKSMNQYTFVENNPGTNNDPLGDSVHSPNIKNCDDIKKLSLRVYDSQAERVIGPARKYTHQKNKVYRKCGKKEFRKWFGCRDSHYRNRRHWAHAERIIRRIDNEIKKYKRYYKCENEGGKRAMASPGLRYIRFYNPFWQTINQSAANTHTLIHETAHKKGAYHSDEWYGYKECRHLADKHATHAKENADNYANFADERYYGRTWSVHDSGCYDEKSCNE